MAITGCMAGRDTDGKIRHRLHVADLFFPTHEMLLLPKRLAEISSDLAPTVSESTFDHYLQVIPRYANTFQAFITISTGCNKKCAYCVVPAARGVQTDRPVKDILAEARGVVEKGCIEVTLLGQTVNWYRPVDPESFSTNNPYVAIGTKQRNYFSALLWELNQLDGLKRLHYTAAHPNHMTDDVIEALTLPKQVNYLHLPVQSGSDKILKAMYRPYTREQYLTIIDKIKKQSPNLALGTDIIVGFSGETEEDFAQTLSLYELCQYDISYNAMYSVRSGTVAAAKLVDDVTKLEKKERWWQIQELMEKITLEKNQRFISREVEVLVDSLEHGWCEGNSREMKRVRFKSDNGIVGSLVNVKIDKVKEWILYGEVTS